MRFIKKILKGPERGENAADSSAIMASEDLERIEQELEKLGHGYEAARLLNRAGDLYLVKSDRERALKRYGEAIDAYLQSGEYDNAMAVCRKIIRVVPEVIRTRRTLAWLCLGKGFLEIAREHVEAYVQASKEAELESLAVQHLLLMGQYVARSDFREFLAGQLLELGDEKAAARVREGQARESVRTAGWTPVVFAAMLTPDDLRHAADKGVEIKPPTHDSGANEVSVKGFEALLIDPDAAAALEEAAAAREAVTEEDGNGIDSGPEQPSNQKLEGDEREGSEEKN